MDFISLIALIIAFIALSKADKAENKLNELLQKKSSAVPQGQQLVSSPVVPAANPVVSQSRILASSTSVQKDSLQRLISWYAHEWQLKTGALFILLGFAWLVSYAFLNNWIGPVGRITLGLVAGTLILLFGERRLKVVQTQGITLVGLGSLVILVSVFAAQNLYEMFPPFVALALVVATMILTSMISLRHKVLSLAVASVVIGGIAPLLTGSTEKNIFGLYSYLLALIIGTLWIARYSTWRILTFLGIIVVTLYSLEYFVTGLSTLQSTLTPRELFEVRFFAVTFVSVFFFSTLSTLVTNKNADKVDIQTAAAVGIFTMGWINGLTAPEYKGMVTLLAALIYSGASYAVFVTTKIKTAVYIYTGIAVFLLAAATAYQFDGPVLVIAFALQALVLPIIGVSLLGTEMGKHLLFYFALPVVLSSESLSEYAWQDTLLNDAFYSLSVVTSSLLASGLYFYQKHREKEAPLHNQTLILLILGFIYALILIWRVFHVIFSPDYLARMASLFVYSFIGLSTYIYGEINKRTVLNKFGLVLLIFVIGRLLLVEVWEMELSARIITFFLIGILFIGSVILRKSTATKP